MKIFYVSVVLLSSAFFAAAQEVHQNGLVLVDTQTVKADGKKPAIKTGKCVDSWFFHIGAGGQMFIGDFDLDANTSFGSRFTLLPEAAIGKWFNPYWALRLKGQGGSLHGFEDEGRYMQHVKYYNLHLDAMWNVANYWGDPSSSRKVGFGPYLGFGYAHHFEMDPSIPAPPFYVDAVKTEFYHRFSDVISLNAGLNLGINLSERVRLDFDLGTTIVPDYFDRVVQDAQNESIISLSGGLTFKFGKICLASPEPVIDPDLIEALNEKINLLRIENAVLAKRPVTCPECPPAVTVTEINYVPNVVFFRLNSYKIDENQRISIYNTAQFMKKTEEKIKVVGYADKATGTSEYNMELSKKRAQAIAEELITKYQIPSERITVEWYGADEQPYPHTIWNRVVIMSTQD